MQLEIMSNKNSFTNRIHRCMEKLEDKFRKHKLYKVCFWICLAMMILISLSIVLIIFLTYQEQQSLKGVSITRVVYVPDATIRVKFKDKKEGYDCFSMNITSNKTIAGIDVVLDKQELKQIKFKESDIVRALPSQEGISLLLQSFKDNQENNLGIICIKGDTGQISKILSDSRFRIYEYATGNRLSVKVQLY